MKYLKSIGLVFVVVLIAVTVSGCAKRDDNSTNNKSSEISAVVAPAEKIVVANFFGTQRCVSCRAIGDFTKKTLNEKFSEELKSGKIEFIEANVELLENKEIANKYQASGSSLFINAVINGKENIEEDVTVWRLVSSEKQFVSYLEQKLNNLMGK